MRLKFDMWAHDPKYGGYMSRFTDGKGRSKESWWSSPPKSIDHVDITYLRNPHRYGDYVKNERHVNFLKKRFKEEVIRLKIKD